MRRHIDGKCVLRFQITFESEQAQSYFNEVEKSYKVKSSHYHSRFSKYDYNSLNKILGSGNFWENSHTILNEFTVGTNILPMITQYGLRFIELLLNCLNDGHERIPSKIFYPLKTSTATFFHKRN